MLMELPICLCVGNENLQVWYGHRSKLARLLPGNTLLFLQPQSHYLGGQCTPLKHLNLLLVACDAAKLSSYLAF